MTLKNAPDFKALLVSHFADADPEQDQKTVETFAASVSPDKLQTVLMQARTLVAGSESLVEELGMEANRWFGDVGEAKDWVQKIVELLAASIQQEGGAGSTVMVKDSNGTPLAEGDAVSVIKDLKVKGGSSDLKRGTLIKKIHLIGDPENIECNVGGSTLVLKTCFLKKA